MLKYVIFFVAAGFCFTACNKKTTKPTPPPVTVEEVVEPEDVEEPEVGNEPVFTEAELNAPVNKTSSANDKYFLISASFSSYANAEKHQKSLQAKGFSSEIITREQGANNDFYKVSYKSFSNYQDALRALDNEKAIPGNENVWLLVKK